MSDLRQPLWAYVLPFGIYIAFLALASQIPGGVAVEYPLRIAASVAAILILSRSALRWDLTSAAGSVMVGVAVFVIWVGPDYLFPEYRRHFLFENSLTGEARSSLPEGIKASFWFLAVRVIGSVLAVPVIEELFWRGWLMRWLISPDFTRVPLGAHQPLAFWGTAVLFALEHGPWWDVGLAAGVIYNLWMIRTKSIWSCILAHSVTNGLLAAYVILGERWEYWL